MAQRGRILDWAGESQYYVEPKRLARLGYLEARKEPGKTRERSFYTLTAKGREALRRWVTEPPAPPRIQNEAVPITFVTESGSVRIPIAASETTGGCV